MGLFARPRRSSQRDARQRSQKLIEAYPGEVLATLKSAQETDKPFLAQNDIHLRTVNVLPNSRYLPLDRRQFIWDTLKGLYGSGMIAVRYQRTDSQGQRHVVDTVAEDDFDFSPWGNRQAYRDLMDALGVARHEHSGMKIEQLYGSIGALTVGSETASPQCEVVLAPHAVMSDVSQLGDTMTSQTRSFFTPGHDHFPF